MGLVGQAVACSRVCTDAVRNGTHAWGSSGPYKPCRSTSSQAANSVHYFSVCHRVVSKGSGCSAHIKQLRTKIPHPNPSPTEPWLITQWQTKKSHILLTEDGHLVLTSLQIERYILKKLVQGIGPRCFDMSSNRTCSCISFQFSPVQ